MAEEIRSLGFDSIELNFALTETQVRDFLKLKRAGRVAISSTHNFCPLPDGVLPKHASPEYYSLSALEDGERKLAVKFTKKSMDFAAELGAGALVIHLGRVEIDDRTKRLFAIADRKRLEKEKAEALREREREAGPFLEKAMLSLEELLTHADTLGLNIALENRYYLKELPSLSEFGMIFKKLNDRRLCYWHDTGHAQVYENLSMLRHEDYLELLAKHLIGIHLHDIILFDDHRAPGSGEFDFGRVRPFLKNDTIKVIEAHRKATAEEVRKSVSYLNGALKL